MPTVHNHYSNIRTEEKTFRRDYITKENKSEILINIENQIFSLVCQIAFKNTDINLDEVSQQVRQSYQTIDIIKDENSANQDYFYFSCNIPSQLQKNPIVIFIFKELKLEIEKLLIHRNKYSQIINRCYNYFTTRRTYTQSIKELESFLISFDLAAQLYHRYRMFHNDEIQYTNTELSFLLQYAYLDIKYKDKKIVLHELPLNKNAKLIQALLEHQTIDVNAKDVHGNTSLHSAVRYAEVELLNALLQHLGIDVNVKDNTGSTPLHIVARYGEIEILNTLLQQPDININAKDNYGNTPLHIVVTDARIELLKIILQHPNIDINAKNALGNTPLHIVAKYREIEILKALLQHPNIDVNTEDSLGNTPLHVVVNDRSGRIKEQERNEQEKKELIEILLKHPNIDVNAKNNDGSTPLHTEDRPSKIFSLLINHPNIDLNAKDNRDETILCKLCLNNRISLFSTFGAIASLLNRGIKISHTINNLNLDLDHNQKILRFITIILIRRKDIVIDNDKSILLSRNIFNRVLSCIPKEIDKVLNTLVDNIENKSLIIDKPIYIFSKLEYYIKNNSYRLENNLDSVEKNINRIAKERFNDTKAIKDDFVIMFVYFTEEDKQELSYNYNKSNNKKFIFNWIKSKDEFILKIDNIKFANFTNKVNNKNNLIDSNNAHLDNNFKDITFRFNHSNPIFLSEEPYRQYEKSKQLVEQELDKIAKNVDEADVTSNQDEYSNDYHSVYSNMEDYNTDNIGGDTETNFSVEYDDIESNDDRIGKENKIL